MLVRVQVVGAAEATHVRVGVVDEAGGVGVTPAPVGGGERHVGLEDDPVAAATRHDARRVEQAQGGSGDNGVGNPGNQNFDFSADDVQQEQVNAQVDLSLEREENTQVQLQDENLRANDSVEISLSNAAQQSQNNINQQAVQDVDSAERSLQVGIEQTNSSLASDEFTRALDDKRELDDASNGESSGARELGRVLDTFA